METRENQDLEVEVDEDVQQVSFHRIEELENYGIAKADIQKLKHGGYHTIESVCQISLLKLLFPRIYLMVS
jgi:predicted DNA-binding protein